jgi:hypothetical protein
MKTRVKSGKAGLSVTFRVTGVTAVEAFVIGSFIADVVAGKKKTRKGQVK